MLVFFQAESNGKDTAASPVCLDELDKLIQTLTLDPEEEPVAKVNLALFSSYNMVSSRISDAVFPIAGYSRLRISCGSYVTIVRMSLNVY